MSNTPTTPNPPLEQLLQAALQALCPRTWPDVAPLGPEGPYVVWSLYGGQSVPYVEGSLAQRRNAFVQVNVWGAGRTTCNALSLQIQAALVAHPQMQCVPLNALRTAFDQDTERRGAMQDFSIWADA